MEWEPPYTVHRDSRKNVLANILTPVFLYSLSACTARPSAEASEKQKQYFAAFYNRFCILHPQIMITISTFIYSKTNLRPKWINIRGRSIRPNLGKCYLCGALRNGVPKTGAPRQ